MLKICPKCGVEHSKPGIFCSRSCANSREQTNEIRLKKSNTIKSKHIKNQFGEFKPRLIHEISGEYTKVYLCKCKYSGRLWYSPSVKQIHPDLARSKHEYTYSCQFRFGISSYPNWFKDASILINTYGWYSTPGSRNGTTNTNGISRDHLYSITDGWVNNIHPSVIRHPANCALIPHKENQSKHKKSKITLEELYDRIKLFDQTYGYDGETRTPDV